MSDHDKRQAGAEIPKAALDEAESFFWDWMNYNAGGVCDKDDAVEIKSLLVGLYMIAIRNKVVIRDTT